MACPEPSTLEAFCLGVQISDVCPDPSGTGGQLAILVSLVNPSAATSTVDYVSDPTNCSIVPTGRIYYNEIETSTDGCICTCPLLPNESDTDVDLAIQPSGTYYSIVVTWNGSVVLNVPQFTLNLEEAQAATLQNFDGCGDCIDLCSLLPPQATVPATDSFCAAVSSCFTPPVLSAPAAGVLTFTPGGVTDALGTVTTHNLIGAEADNLVTAGANGGLYVNCAGVLGCVNIQYASYNAATHTNGAAATGAGTAASPWQMPLPVIYDLAPTIAQATGAASLTGSDGTTDSLLIASQSAGQILGYGADGGLFLDCAEVLGCANFAYVAYDAAVHDAGVIEGAGTAAAPWQIPLPSADADTTYDLSATITQAGGTVALTGSDATTDSLLLVSQDAGQLVGYGADGGLFLDCAEVLGCANISYVPFDALVHTAGVVTGSGTAAAPWQIPLPTAADFNTTYDLTPTIDQAAGTISLAGSDATTDPALIVSQDAGQLVGYGTDGGLFLDCAGVTACLNFTYVTLDPAQHTAGTAIDGTGTAADPWQIPLPPVGLETPAGQAYPDTDADNVFEIGLEDQDGNVLPFDAATGEWTAPIDRVGDLGAAGPVAPTQNTTQPFVSYDTVTVNGADLIEESYVWNPATGAFNRVLSRVRDLVIESGTFPANAATAVGDHPATPLTSDDGLLTGVWVAADNPGATDVTVNVLVAGVAAGSAVIPAGTDADAPVLATLLATPTPLTAGQIGTFTIAGDGTPGDTITDITVTFDMKA